LKALLALASSALALAGATSKAQPRFHVLAHVDPGGGYAGDVVGERHYAYLSSHTGRDCPAQGVRVYDLSNPRRPQHIATFADGTSQPELAHAWTEKTVVRRIKTPGFDGVLAVTSVQACAGAGAGGFALYDVTQPAQPKLLSVIRTEPRGSHEIWLAAARGHAWVYTAEAVAEFAMTPDAFGFHIWDVTHPRAPSDVGGWSACRTLHKCTPLNPPPGRDVRILVHSVIANAAATRAYLAYWNLGTVILDIADPRHPRYLGRTPPGQGNVHSDWLMRRGKILLETHEIAHGRATVWDISRPSRPRKLSEVRLARRLRPGGEYPNFYGLADSVHDPKAAGRLGYFSWYAQGVALFDLSNLRRPRYLTRFRPPPDLDEHGLLCPGDYCTAVWGVFPTRRYVLVSDLNSGLWVLSRPG
jgi:hypothetical protein